MALAVGGGNAWLMAIWQPGRAGPGGELVSVPVLRFGIGIVIGYIMVSTRSHCVARSRPGWRSWR
jgi:hypothetical protein